MVLAMVTDAKDKIYRLLEEYSGVPRKRMHMETQLLSDLHLDGDDAAALLMAFAKRFGVGLNEFEFSRFFHSEAELFRSEDAGKVKAAIRIQDLVQVVSEKNWKCLEKTGTRANGDPRTDQQHSRKVPCHGFSPWCQWLTCRLSWAQESPNT